MAKAFENLGIGLAKAGENAAGILEKAKNAAVNIVDQNGDGKIGQDDFSAIKGAVKSAMKENSEKWVEKQEQVKRDRELKELRPFFLYDIEGPGFSLPKLIRIAEMDTKHAESSVCEDSVYFLRGFDTTLFRAESVKYRRNQGLFVMKALFLMAGIWSKTCFPPPRSAPARVRGCIF